MHFKDLNDDDATDRAPGAIPPDAADDDDGGGVADALADQETTFVAEQKKPINNTLLVLLGMVLLGGGGIYLMYARGGPSAADAAVASPSAVTAQQAVGEFLADGGRSMTQMRRMLEGTQKVVAQFAQYPSTQQVPLDDLRSNPFRLAPEKAPAAADVAEAARKRRDEERAAVLKSVQALQLQSVMKSGTRANCMINNSLYHEGQTVDGFTIERITTDRVVVRKDAYKFELKMSR